MYSYIQLLPFAHCRYKLVEDVACLRKVKRFYLCGVGLLCDRLLL